MAYCHFHTCRGDGWEVEHLDRNGSALYETEYGDPLLENIRRNGISKLEECILVSSKEATVGPEAVYHLGPFYVAASHGSTAALRLLLNTYAAVLAEWQESQTTPLERRGFSLLLFACGFARAEAVRFLMDDYYSNHDPLELLSSKGRHDETLFLSAAASLAYLKSLDDIGECIDIDS